MMKLSNNYFSKQSKYIKRVLLSSKPFFLKHRRILLIFLLLLSIFVFLLSWKSPFNELVIEEAKTGKVLWRDIIVPDEEFEYRYIHSVQLTPVMEKYIVNESGFIVLKESWTQSFGAGLPYESNENIEFIDEFYVIKNINRTVAQINFLPSNLNVVTFHYKDHIQVLSEPPFARKHLRIEVLPLTWAKWSVLYKFK